jgi:putative membrane protein
MSLVEPAPKDIGTILAEERTNLALQRTIIAAERTLMAWIRTALSMIGFGFTIYKFFQYQADEIAAGHIQRPQAPRNLGLSLIALGTLALAAATWQHRKFLKSIGASQKDHMISISVVVAMVVVLIGLVTFYGVLLKSGPF